MAEKKKKAAAEPAMPTMHAAFDAKATLACGEFLAWAHRAGEGAPDAMIISRKGAQRERLSDGSYREPGFGLTVAELPVLIALLQKFKDDTLPALEKYGVEEDDE